jgi:hypothetical protein
MTTTNTNSFNQLMNDILNQLSVNIGAISFHDRNSGYNGSPSNPSLSQRFFQQNQQTLGNQGNKTGTKSVDNIKIGKSFTIKNVEQLNETLLPVLDNTFKALGNSTQTEINKYYEILKGFTKEFLIKLINIQQNKTLTLDYQTAGTYKDSYENLIKCIAKLTDDKYFVDNESNVTSMTNSALANNLHQTIEDLESDLQSVETLFNDEMDKLNKQKKADVYTKGHWPRLTSSGVSGLFSSSSISKLEIKTDEYPSNYFMYLIWLGRTLRYLYCYKGTQLSFDIKKLSQLEHISITVPKLKICPKKMDPLSYKLLKLLCNIQGKPVKGSLIIMTFLEIMVCHNIEFFKNKTSHTNAAFKSIELIIDDNCPAIKLSPLNPIPVTTSGKKNDDGNIFNTVMKFIQQFLLAVGTMGYKKCIDNYGRQDFNSIKFTTINSRDKYKNIFNKNAITKIIGEMQLIDKKFHDNFHIDEEEMFDCFKKILQMINDLYNILPQFFIDWEKFFNYLNITPEHYKKIFSNYIDTSGTSDTHYPLLIYHEGDKEDGAEQGEEEQADDKGDDKGDEVVQADEEDGAGGHGDEEDGAVLQLLNDCHGFVMDIQKYNRIKSNTHGCFFITKKTNGEVLKNIFFTNNNEWYIYDHTNKPSIIIETDPRLNGKTILPYHCVYNIEGVKACKEEVFVMLEKLTDVHSHNNKNICYGEYKNTLTDKIFKYIQNDDGKNEWIGEDKQRQNTFTVNNVEFEDVTTNVEIKYPSYPPFGKYKLITKLNPHGNDLIPGPLDDSTSGGPPAGGPSGPGDLSSASGASGPPVEDGFITAPRPSGPPASTSTSLSSDSTSVISPSTSPSGGPPDPSASVSPSASTSPSTTSTTSTPSTSPSTTSTTPSTTSTTSTPSTSPVPSGGPGTPGPDDKELKKAEDGKEFIMSAFVFLNLPTDSWYKNRSMSIRIKKIDQKNFYIMYIDNTNKLITKKRSIDDTNPKFLSENIFGKYFQKVTKSSDLILPSFISSTSASVSPSASTTSSTSTSDSTSSDSTSSASTSPSDPTSSPSSTPSTSTPSSASSPSVTSSDVDKELQKAKDGEQFILNEEVFNRLPHDNVWYQQYLADPNENRYSIKKDDTGQGYMKKQPYTAETPISVEEIPKITRNSNTFQKDVCDGFTVDQINSEVQKANDMKEFTMCNGVFDKLHDVASDSDTKPREWYINITSGYRYIISKVGGDYRGSFLTKINLNSDRTTSIDIKPSVEYSNLNDIINTGQKYIKITEEQFKTLKLNNRVVVINGIEIDPYKKKIGGFKIRKTIKKKYRKSKFLTRKNKKILKKKISIKKLRTLKRKYKRIL